MAIAASSGHAARPAARTLHFVFAILRFRPWRWLPKRAILRLNIGDLCQKDALERQDMPVTKLDPIDRKIVNVLQSDGRMSINDLAAQVGLSPSPCLRRVRLLEKAGIINRYVAVLDQRAVGLPVSVFISIKLDKQREEMLERFGKTISRWPEVLECYLMTGQRDYLLRVVVPDLPSYERFLKTKLTRLDGIASIESSFALEQVKYTNVLPVE
jgi:Lrp/AsnC family leucine-responsive transcriptional regulator